MKTVKIAFDDILLDQTAAASLLMEACARGGWMLSGICELSDSLAVFLSKGDDDIKGFVFDRFSGDDDESRLADVRQRYDSGFDIVGTFFIGDQAWALYKKRI